MTQINKNYNSSQAELYGISHLGWGICQQHQIQIMPRFPQYTAAYIQTKINAIIAAETSPDFQARDFLTETQQLELKNLANLAINEWKFLEQYILNSLQSTPEFIKPHLEAAGKNYYSSATQSHPDWEDARLMFIAGTNYLVINLPTIQAFLPATFSVDYNTAALNFENKWQQFTASEYDSTALTAAKITANNQIHADLMRMLDNIQQILPAHLKDQATFTHLKSIISSPGPAGLKGTITDSITAAPIVGANLSLGSSAQDTTGDYETTTTATGNYDFGNIASGTYNLQITHPNYQTLEISVTIRAGVTSTQNNSLTPNP